MRMMQKTFESVRNLDFYQLNSNGLELQWALALYPEVVLIIIRQGKNYIYFENPVSRSGDSLLTISEEIHRAVWEAELWGCLSAGIPEEEMNLVLLKHSYPQLYFM
jgi:hypothetical protein